MLAISVKLSSILKCLVIRCLPCFTTFDFFFNNCKYKSFKFFTKKSFLRAFTESYSACLYTDRKGNGRLYNNRVLKIA